MKKNLNVSLLMLLATASSAQVTAGANQAAMAKQQAAAMKITAAMKAKGAKAGNASKAAKAAAVEAQEILTASNTHKTNMQPVLSEISSLKQSNVNLASGLTGGLKPTPNTVTGSYAGFDKNFKLDGTTVTETFTNGTLTGIGNTPAPLTTPQRIYNALPNVSGRLSTLRNYIRDHADAANQTEIATTASGREVTLTPGKSWSNLPIRGLNRTIVDVGTGASALGSGVMATGRALSSGASAVGSGVMATGSALASGASALGSSASNALSSAGNALSSGASAVGSAIYNSPRTLVNSLPADGRIIAGTGRALSSGASAVGSALSSAATAAGARAVFNAPGAAIRGLQNRWSVDSATDAATTSPVLPDAEGAPSSAPQPLTPTDPNYGNTLIGGKSIFDLSTQAPKTLTPTNPNYGNTLIGGKSIFDLSTQAPKTLTPTNPNYGNTLIGGKSIFDLSTPE